MAPFATLGLLLLALAGCGAAERAVLPGFGSGWSAMRSEVPTDSLTVQRIRRAPAAEPEVLSVEPGNVWPEQEGQRATLADPDAALRGGPRPTFPEAPRSAAPTRFSPRADGRVIQTPDGAVVTTGGTGRVQGTMSPRGSGVAIRDGNTVTVVEPGLPPRLVPAPR